MISQPSFPKFNEKIKANPMAPAIRFVRIHGRIVPIVQGHKKRSLAPLVQNRISEMKTEISVAQKGGRGHSYDKESGIHKNFKITSTFPGWYANAGFKNRNEFMNVLEKKSGTKFDRLGEQAINDLKSGYNTSHGRVPPNKEFNIKTRQVFDNTNVVFRRIAGKVRPIKTSEKKIAQGGLNKVFNDEVPF